MGGTIERSYAREFMGPFDLLFRVSSSLSNILGPRVVGPSLLASAAPSRMDHGTRSNYGLALISNFELLLAPIS